MSQPIQPLRISKGTPQASPSKMSQRPLSELSPMERRRNSPSFNQTTGKPLLDSSPFDSSPFASKITSSPFLAGSPRSYWQYQDRASPKCLSGETRYPCDDSPAPSKRSSIEKLKQASRVKNSTMFAREQKLEYDPTSVLVVERPLAAGRPLSVHARQSPFDNKTEGKLPQSPLKHDAIALNRKQQSNQQTSPGKSSLSKNSRYGHGYDGESGTWSEDDCVADRQLPAGKALHRHAKSVTFDAAPPEVNEYEMATPDPSSVASGSREGSYDSVEEDDDSMDRESSLEKDDSFDASLEDTDKTPVVLPDEWRFMNPGFDRPELTLQIEDPFIQKQNSQFAENLAQTSDADSPVRTSSVNSAGERRPLPPLPPSGQSVVQTNPEATNGIYAAAERATLCQRTLPSPPLPSSVSKSELQTTGTSSISLEERLRLMMLQEDDKIQASRTAAEVQRERRLRRGGASPERSSLKDREIKIHEDDPEKGVEEGYALPKRISRESILEKVKSKNLDAKIERLASVSSSPTTTSAADIDPDTPIPSLEETLSAPIADDGTMIKQERDDESEVDVYAIPDMYQQHGATSIMKEGRDSAPKGNEETQGLETDDESLYSTDANGVSVISNLSTSLQGDALATANVAKDTPNQEGSAKRGNRMSLPQFASMLGEADFSVSLSSYMISKHAGNGPGKIEDLSTLAPPKRGDSAYDERPLTPTDYIISGSEDLSTPESVIRYSIPEEPRSESPDSQIEPETPTIPEPAATIKAPGGRLKTRASLAPADVQQMAEARRKVSGDETLAPPIPDRHFKRPSVIPEGDSSIADDDETDTQKASKRKSSLVPLDVTVDEIDEGLSFGLDKEFDRLIEAQKKGYLMRQNTKVVVASSASHESAEASQPKERMVKSAGNSPVKQSQAGTWTTEPWNGRIRRKSIRQSAGSPIKRPAPGVVPPLPGLSSVVTTNADQIVEEPTFEVDELDESGERGRLFVKVVGAKDLELPLPRGERSYFALTLDNGLHCVTTAWLELGKNALIGQEFELVVLNELEFQLTLQTKIEQPKSAKTMESPAKKTQKPSAFSRVFASPKKRKELEIKQQQQAQKAHQLEMAAKGRQPQTAWELLHNLVAKDGSFGRSYVSLKDHEAHAYGRPYTVDVPCFNEWAMEEVRTLSSSRSGRGTVAPTLQRKAPYKIGKLELQLLYVPKPKEARDEDMPKSMNACVRELAEAERAANQAFEGHLSQQGGDCPYWRRRFFRLQGSKLTAYHDLTRQPRATISLAKASKLIDDKSSLTQKEASGKGGSRRKSAFAAEEEGYMFVEEGFRVRFANGETIDFYADSRADKDEWMRVLSEVIGKDTKTARSWTDIVLRREKATAAALATKTNPFSNTIGMKSAPPTPGNRKSSRCNPPRPMSQQQNRPMSADKPLPGAPVGLRDQRTKISEAERRAKARSMVF